jgi:hypothetical protein
MPEWSDFAESGLTELGESAQPGPSIPSIERIANDRFEAAPTERAAVHSAIHWQPLLSFLFPDNLNNHPHS